MQKKSESLGDMSPEALHARDMESFPGYKELIEGGLTRDEAIWFVSLAAVENHAPWNLSEQGKTELAEMRKRLANKGVSFDHLVN